MIIIIAERPGAHVREKSRRCDEDFSVTDSRDALISHALIVQYDSQRSIQKVVFPERKLKQTTRWHQKRRDTEIDLADQNIPLPHGGLLSRS